MLLFFRDTNNLMLYPINSPHANLKVTEGKDNQRSLKWISKVLLFQEVVEGKLIYLLNTSIKISSPQNKVVIIQYIEGFLYHLLYFQFHLCCQKSRAWWKRPKNGNKKKYARNKYYIFDQTIMFYGLSLWNPLYPIILSQLQLFFLFRFLILRFRMFACSTSNSNHLLCLAWCELVQTYDKENHH